MFNPFRNMPSSGAVDLAVKTPVNAVAASGVVTFSGTPQVYVPNVNASGTVTVSGTPLSVANVDASGLVTITGTPLSVPNTDATGTVTVTGTPVLNEQLVVGAQTFVFKVIRTGVGEITIDADNTNQAANIVTALTADLATVTSTNTLGVVHITSVAHGAAGNSIVLTTNATGVSVSGAGTLTGGVTAVVETLTVGAQVFTFKTSGSATGDIVISAVNATQAANIVTSIARDLGTVAAVQGTGGNNNKVTVTAVAHGVAGNALVLAKSATGVTVSGSGHLAGGTDAVVETLVVGAQTFTFVNSGSATGNIVISATPAVQAANIVTAITRDLATVNAVQGTGGSTNIVTVTAVANGTAGNSLTLTKNATGIAVSGAGTLAGGVNQVREIVTIGVQDFVFVTTRSGAGSFQVTINANHTTQGDNLVAAMADISNALGVNSGGAVTVTAAVKGVAGNNIVLSTNATGTAVSSVTGGKIDGGVDGTIGQINEMCADANYVYRCIATNTIADSNWTRIATGASF